MLHLPTPQLSLLISLLFWMAAKVFLFSMRVSSVVSLALFHIFTAITAFTVLLRWGYLALAKTCITKWHTFFRTSHTRAQTSTCQSQHLDSLYCLGLIPKKIKERIGVKAFLQIEGWIRSKKQAVVFHSPFLRWRKVWTSSGLVLFNIFIHHSENSRFPSGQGSSLILTKELLYLSTVHPQASSCWS